MFYPKLLPWKAKKAGVPEPVARQLWFNTMLTAKLTGTEQEYQLINQQFDTQLSLVGIPYQYTNTITENIKTTYNNIGETIKQALSMWSKSFKENQHA